MYKPLHQSSITGYLHLPLHLHLSGLDTAPQTRIVLGERRVIREVRPPSVAVVVERLLIRIADAVLEILRPLEELVRQAARHVPGNMAVHQPRARVVGAESDEQPALGGKHGDVAPGRVVALQAGDVHGRVEHIAGLADGGHVGRPAEDEEVVAVQMDGMRQAERAVGVVLDEPVLPLVDAVNLDDVVRLRVVGEARHHVLQNGLVPVDVNGRSVNAPDEAVERDGDRVARVERDAVGVQAALQDGLQVDEV